MHLFLLGASHHSAPVDLRERIDFSRRGVTESLAELAEIPAVAEAIVLSTCNRSEIYVASEVPERLREALPAFMSSFHDVPEPELAAYLYSRTDAAVARHLFRVTAGLDSLVVGEPQILGQGEGRVHRGVRAGIYRSAAESPIPLVVWRRQARAFRDRPGRRGGLGELCGHLARPQDLR